ncbi:18271_t:CDS:2, partial [Gigaspora margarita]
YLFVNIQETLLFPGAYLYNRCLRIAEKWHLHQFVVIDDRHELDGLPLRAESSPPLMAKQNCDEKVTAFDDQRDYLPSHFQATSTVLDDRRGMCGKFKKMTMKFLNGPVKKKCTAI